MGHPDAESCVFDDPAAAKDAIRTLGPSGLDMKKLPPVGMKDMGRAMEITTHRARITGPVSYLSGSGRRLNIPIGPCLVERLGGRSIDIIWGARGQRSVALPVEEIQAARDQGHLLLLD